MTGPLPSQSDILALASRLKEVGAPFALATVVRTVSVTAAKAGAKAVIRADGTIHEGWIGGGCARAAVLRAAREALEDGRPRLISIQPGDVLEARGVTPGDEVEGVRFARNMCPSQGTMDVFVEPVVPAPELVIWGESPVARALAGLAPGFGFELTLCAPGEDAPGQGNPDAPPGDGTPVSARGRYVVVATQGAGDEAALKAALGAPADYVAFVGSRAKMAALDSRLRESGADPARLEALHAPAGLDIGAITPEEIALSVLAEIVLHRRKGQRRKA
ncbi:XdhC /CoxI family-like protein [Maritimibacter sp. 55A14]|uniref:XdhC family protein n=1 Tax=Maritimibacter sp. 55A14 TaxID=2174844 RepID=UPI000D61AD02|nr:XdhC/CoxI family protein [Maritimibacter sp. 55A14]PWE34232.1 XdhC /CoxI family-like protein [Maritimibacter sp. 55A14]